VKFRTGATTGGYRRAHACEQLHVHAQHWKYMLGFGATMQWQDMSPRKM